MAAHTVDHREKSQTAVGNEAIFVARPDAAGVRGGCKLEIQGFPSLHYYRPVREGPIMRQTWPQSCTKWRVTAGLTLSGAPGSLDVFLQVAQHEPLRPRHVPRRQVPERRPRAVVAGQHERGRRQVLD